MKKRLDFEKDHYIQLWKMPVVNMLLLGFYIFYWVYHSWEFVIKNTNKKISSGWRTVFFFFVMPISGIVLFYELLSITTNYNKYVKTLVSILLTLIFDIICYYPKDETFDIKLILTCLFLCIIPIMLIQNSINKYVSRKEKNNELHKQQQQQ